MFKKKVSTFRTNSANLSGGKIKGKHTETVARATESEAKTTANDLNMMNYVYVVGKRL